MVAFTKHINCLISVSLTAFHACLWWSRWFLLQSLIFISFLCWLQVYYDGNTGLAVSHCALFVMFSESPTMSSLSLQPTGVGEFLSYIVSFCLSMMCQSYPYWKIQCFLQFDHRVCLQEAVLHLGLIHGLVSTLSSRVCLRPELILSL